MEEFVDTLREQAPAIVERFYASLSRLPKSKRILDMLSEDELRHLKSQQINNLIQLASPGLQAHEHERMALRVGRIHAIVGLDKEELAHSRGILSSVVYELIGHRVDPVAMVRYSRMLSRDLAYQFKAYQDLMDAQQSVLQRIMKIAWTVQSYADFIRQTVDILSTHDEIALCAISRPDESGVFRFEAMAGLDTGGAMPDMLLSPGRQPVTHVDHAHGHGPVSLAWRSGEVQRIINFLTCPPNPAFASHALAAGLRSCAAVPLRIPDRSASAVLLLFSAFPGGFIGPHQESFLSLLQTILGNVILRLRERDEGGRIISVSTRLHMAALLRSDALQIHYQPLLDARTGRIDKVEALARLSDASRILKPADFFPALSSDDFLELFERGLARTLSDRRRWLDHGTDLGVSINLPPAALSDIRYFEAARKALAAHDCPAGRLTLEVLEDESIPLCEGQSLLSAFKSLGVILAQDDLGAGHSSLIRLRKLPFDCIKIDRGIINVSGDADALKVLRFVYQLTRLGHSLGKSVVVEGVETMEMLRAMTILGVDSVQGYVLAQPMPYGEMLPWIDRWRPEAREFQAMHGTLPRLAQLTLWEERLSLCLKMPGVARKLFSITRSAMGDEGRARGMGSEAECRMCPLSCSLFDSAHAIGMDALPREIGQSVFDTALADGTDSPRFKIAYSRLVDAILARQ